MIRTFMVILALLLAAGCSGGGGDVLKNDTEEETEEETGEETEAEAPGVPDELSQNLASFAFSPDKSSVTVEIAGIDSTPVEVTYNRNPNLDTAGYLAYTVQEDALDRLFVALGAESPDGSTRAAIVSDGGQFNRVIQGGYYERDGSYNPPDVGPGPGQGQVSYAGGYAGITNITSANGSELIEIPDTVDPDTLPDLPGQAAIVRGLIFINANFAENKVNGGIYNRILVSPIDGTDAQQLDDIALIITDIDENGEFLGEVEFDGFPDRSIGSYGGIFGGENASFVAGIVALDEFDEDRTGEIEIGVFVLTQCGQTGDAEVCDIVEPD
ncbi:hypothetical protein ACOXXX_03450 [Thalassococcus sp. BH17M4-6]|uniref:hypothetical protein n=1 Tax=Thalassococcus sp. BH17M4-6 TaxID=3413148 RepID=UPI003BC72A30